MPKYKTHLATPPTVEFWWHDDDHKLIGTIRLKDSGVQWKKKNARKWQTISLTKFAELMEAHGRSTTK